MRSASAAVLEGRRAFGHPDKPRTRLHSLWPVGRGRADLPAANDGEHRPCGRGASEPHRWSHALATGGNDCLTLWCALGVKHIDRTGCRRANSSPLSGEASRWAGFILPPEKSPGLYWAWLLDPLAPAPAITRGALGATAKCSRYIQSLKCRHHRADK